MPLEIEKSQVDGNWLIKVSGEVDLYTSPDLRSALHAALPSTSDRIGVDLASVPYMDSSGVATLVEGLRSANDKQVSFVLVSPSESVMKVLQLTRLDAVFTIQEAL